MGLQNGAGPLTPEAQFLPPAPQVGESAHVTSTMDTQCTGSSSAGPLEGPSASAWGAQRNRPGATKGQVDIWAEKKTDGIHICGLPALFSQNLDWGLPPLPRVPAPAPVTSHQGLALCQL